MSVGSVRLKIHYTSRTAGKTMWREDMQVLGGGTHKDAPHIVYLWRKLPMKGLINPPPPPPSSLAETTNYVVTFHPPFQYIRPSSFLCMCWRHFDRGCPSALVGKRNKLKSRCFPLVVFFLAWRKLHSRIWCPTSRRFENWEKMNDKVEY